MRALKMRRAVAGRWMLTTTENIIKTDLETTGELVQELNVEHSMVTRHLKQIGKVKLDDMWVPHELIENVLKRRFGRS